MPDSDLLYTLVGGAEGAEDSVPVPRDLVLVHHLEGFVDAGSAASSAVEALLNDHRRIDVARFDADRLVDHRSRRPVMHFDTDRWTGYDAPHITVSLLRPPRRPGARAAAACTASSRTTAGRPSGVPCSTWSSGSACDWSSGCPRSRWVSRTPGPRVSSPTAPAPSWCAADVPGSGQVRVPGNVGGLPRAAAGRGGCGRHGVHRQRARTTSPRRSTRTRQPSCWSICRGVSGVPIDVDELRVRAVQTRAEIDAEVAKSPEVRAVVSALEEQYDNLAESAGSRPAQRPA